MPDGSPSHTSAVRPPIALTIAGFDPSSGAGVTADLQVFAAHGLFGTSCITALTVQSTQGVASVEPVSHLIDRTLENLDADLPPDGIKIGMLRDAKAVLAVARFLTHRKGPKIPIVLDPVMRSSSGASLLDRKGVSALKEELLPLVDWITPNADELSDLSGVLAVLECDAADALRGMHRRRPYLHIVATGGDYAGCVDTLIKPDGEIRRFEGEYVETTSTHGTGCAFSSALLSRLILGDTPEQAVAAAKAYVSEALKQAPGLGNGKGPLNLLWPLTQGR